MLYCFRVSTFLVFVLFSTMVLGQERKTFQLPPDASFGPAEFRIQRNGASPTLLTYFHVLRNDSNLDLLELSEEQENSIKEVMAKVGPRIRDINDAMDAKKQAIDSRQKIAMRKKAEIEAKTELKKEIDQILLPHQQQQIKKAMLTEVKKQIGLNGLVATPWVREQLELTDEQLEGLQQSIVEGNQKLKRDIQEMVEEMTQQAEKKVLKAQLDAKQFRMFQSWFFSEGK